MRQNLFWQWAAAACFAFTAMHGCKASSDVDFERSELRLSPTEDVAADGKASATLTVVLRGRHYRPIAGRQVRIDTQPESDQVVVRMSGSSTDGSGLLHATIASKISGPVELSVHVEDGATTLKWPATPVVTFRASDEDEVYPSPGVQKCDDSNPCTDDIRDGDGNCVHTNNTAECDDGRPCTHSDSCSGGTCLGVAYECEGTSECVERQCLGDGTCVSVNLPAGSACGNRADTPCSNPDTCDGQGLCDPNHEPVETTCGQGLTEYRCGGGLGCDARPQTRTTRQHCEPDTGECGLVTEEWMNLGLACDANEICEASATSAACVPCVPPSDTCLDSSTAVHYDDTARCLEGRCEYSEERFLCGECVGEGECFVFYEDFETDDGLWVSNADPGSTVVEYTDAGGAAGTLRSLLIREQRDPDYGTMFDGVYRAFSRIQPTYVSYYAAADQTESRAMYFGLVDWDERRIIEVFFNDNSMISLWGMLGITPVEEYEAGRWYRIELKNIDWSAKTYDFYLNGLLKLEGQPFDHSDAHSISFLSLYQWNNGAGWWDEIQMK